MLKSIKDSLAVKGRTNTAIANDIGKSAQTVTAWFSGRFYIPIRIRSALISAMGAPIDWDAYEVQFAAFQATRPAKAAPVALPPALPLDEDLPDDAPPPAPAMAPPAPTEAQQVPKRRLTATPPAKNQTLRRAAPAMAAAPKRSFLGWLSDPSDNGMKFE